MKDQGLFVSSFHTLKNRYIVENELASREKESACGIFNVSNDDGEARSRYKLTVYFNKILFTYNQDVSFTQITNLLTYNVCLTPLIN